MSDQFIRLVMALGLITVAVAWFHMLWEGFRSDYIIAERRYRGLCLKCGYSLHGLIEPRCPECGTAFEPRPASP